MTEVCSFLDGRIRILLANKPNKKHFLIRKGEYKGVAREMTHRGYAHYGVKKTPHPFPNIFSDKLNAAFPDEDEPDDAEDVSEAD